MVRLGQWGKREEWESGEHRFEKGGSRLQKWAGREKCSVRTQQFTD